MRTKASFGLSISVVARRAASGVLKESRFMMVRVKQVSEFQVSGAAASRRGTRLRGGRRRDRSCDRAGPAERDRAIPRPERMAQGNRYRATRGDQPRPVVVAATDGIVVQQPCRMRMASRVGRSGVAPASASALAVMLISSVFIGLSARLYRLQCEFLNPSKTLWIADFRSGH
ncbi:hypothetical protein [Burkholderia stabilis]|uniref:hypothetical protein n=1 Tax=Burkholderia stabilis TaxID=95485 RepID=UPI00155FE5C9|nr:hypothetical protein [Burkholderia stabilis]